MLHNKWLLISVALLTHGSAGQLPMVLCIFMGQIQVLCFSFGTQAEGIPAYWSINFSGHKAEGKGVKSNDTHACEVVFSCISLSDASHMAKLNIRRARKFLCPQQSKAGWGREGEEIDTTTITHCGDRASSCAWVMTGHFSRETHVFHFWEVLLNNFIHDFLHSVFFILDF